MPLQNRAIHSILTHLAEEAKPPDQINLWPSIHSAMLESNLRSQPRISPMNTYPARTRQLRFALAVSLTLLIALTLLFASPQGRAWAREFLHFFTRSTSDSLPVQSFQLTPLPTPGTPTPDPASILDVHQTVGEAAQLAGYAVLQPSWLPDSLSLVGASYQPDQHIVRIFYRYAETNGLILKQEPIQKNEECDLCAKVGATAPVETVQIGPAAGEYVEGVWSLTDKGPVWQSDPYIKTLRWQADNMAFELFYMGPPDTLSKADLVAIAQSLH